MALFEPSIRILAGAAWADRLASPHPGPDSRWFEPLHVRAPGRVRDALIAQVEAGADILLAPVWLTHRRALMEVGESRRAAEWTAAAVRVAREAAEEGSSRRADGSAMDVLVGGPLPDLERADEPGEGHIASRDVAAERDVRTQAALLADAGVDLILVEPRDGEGAARQAVTAAAETGPDVWAAWSPSSGPMLAWTEAVIEAGASVVMWDPSFVADPAADAARSLVGSRGAGIWLPTGSPAPSPDDARSWLDAGASVLAIAEAASPDALEPLEKARAEVQGARTAARAAADADWDAWLDRATAYAPGGAGLWLTSDSAPSSAAGALPPGFRWTTAPTGDLGRLPDHHFRLVVAPSVDVPLSALSRLLDDGGVALIRRTAGEAGSSGGLRTLERQDTDDGTASILILRRER